MKTRLARDVGAEIPGVAAQQQRAAGGLGDVADPVGFGLGRGLDAGLAGLAHGREAVGDPHSTWCSIDMMTLLKTAGLPGPMTVKRLGKPV